MSASFPEWAEWPTEPHPLGEFTIGVEEEVMMISAISNALANRIDAVMPVSYTHLTLPTNREV